MHRIIACCLVLAVLSFAGPGFALECSSPTLKGASGVIGNNHNYKITGDCTYTWKETDTSIFSSTTTTGALSFSYVGSARWDRQTGEAVEKLKFTGDASGERAASTTCSQDPFLKDPPGGAATCGPVKVQIEIESGNIYQLLLKGGFWSSKKLSLAEAQALSALPPPSQPPPPEKPKAQPVAGGSMPAEARPGGIATTVGAAGQGTVTAGPPPQDVAGRAAVIERMQRGADTMQRMPAESQRATEPAIGSMARESGGATPGAQPMQMEFEGEAFVKSGAFELNGGQARMQEMSGFGSGWSGNAQLFWSDGAPGAVLDLLVDVPADSKYAVEIYMTRAPDFGMLSFEIDGTASVVPFDGMAPQVTTSGPIQLGIFPLKAGQRRVAMMITGKYPQSTNYYVGIDKLRLYPAGPID